MAGQGAPAPRPLYGLELLASREGAPVLVTEGEKAAEAARLIFPEFAVVTSPNGAEAAAQADWSPLTGKQVTIWPDADVHGRDFASEVGDLAATAGAASVAVVSVPATWPDGWDLADPPPEGVSVKDLHQMVAEAGAAAERKVCLPLSLVRPVPRPQPFPRCAWTDTGGGRKRYA